ncbi:MAG: hypothetical protein R3F31_00755 [Verrucomicrobiales bacterium]|nr:hypothetical protein [Verrucomicrobiae bacterium]MCP5553184.1 hypothetical protein [Akkermansiaceae bacterium]HRX53567.1 hypothetical protein [Verrucomicrobiales bacterium]
MKPSTFFLLPLGIAMAVTGPAAVGHSQDGGWDSAAYGGGGNKTSGGGLFGASIFQYGYLDAGYYLYEFDNAVIESANGFAGTLSIPIVDSFFVKASAGFASPKSKSGEDLNYLNWDLGAGVGLPIFEQMDLVLEGGMAHQRFTSSILDDPIDGWGWYASPALRLMIGDLLELNGGVTLQNVKSDGTLSVDVKALLHLTPSVSLTGGVSFSEDVNRYGVGMRISF